MAIKGGYSVILHGPRHKFGLSLAEACLASIIYHLSNSPRAPVRGWCSAGTQKIADFIGDTTRQTVRRHCIKLAELGLIEKDPKTNYLRTTMLYYDEFEGYNHDAFLGREQNIPVQTSLDLGREQNIPAPGTLNSQPGTLSSTILYNTNSNTNKKKAASLFDLGCYSDELDCEFENWKEMRKKIRKPLTANAEQLAVNKLAGLAGSDPVLAVKLVQQAILNCWLEFYPLKPETNGGGRNFPTNNGYGSKPSPNAHSGGKKDFTED